jgi:CDP-diacylglycerol--glycerol-3-phosphate 3-phosphatidyltransferase
MIQNKILLEKGKVWTASNLLSLSRLVIGLFLYILIINHHSIGAILLSLIAIFTDYADGYLARKRNEISELGKILDPVADKVTVGLSSIALYQAYGLPFWVVIFIVGRDFLILLGSVILLGKINHVAPSELPGKIAVTVISFLLLSYLFDFNPVKIPLLVLTILIIIISFVYYLVKFIIVLKQNRLEINESK